MYLVFGFMLLMALSDSYEEFSSDRLSKEPSHYVPANSAIITMANSFHIDLINYQIQVLRHRGIFKHLVNSFYVVNLDLDSYERCSFLKLRNCVRGGGEAIIPRSDYKAAAYHNVIFAKWHILKQALKTFSYVFFLDGDVVLFDNPWDGIRQNINDYDMQYQLELVGEPDRVNSGQMIFRNSNAALSLIDYVLSKQNSEEDRLDQEWVNEAAEHAGAKTLALPETYVGACWKNSIDIPITDVVSLHFHCVENIKKMAHMRIMSNVFISNFQANDHSAVLRDIKFDSHDSTYDTLQVVHDNLIFTVHNDTDSCFE